MVIASTAWTVFCSSSHMALYTILCLQTQEHRRLNIAGGTNSISMNILSRISFDAENLAWKGSVSSQWTAALLVYRNHGLELWLGSSLCIFRLVMQQAHLFMVLSPSNAFDTTSMLTCLPSPYVSEMSTRSASSAPLIFSLIDSISSAVTCCCSGGIGDAPDWLGVP